MVGRSEEPPEPGVGFDPSKLVKTTIAIPLIEELDERPRARHHVIIDLNLIHPGGLERARDLTHDAIEEITGKDLESVVDVLKGEFTAQYVYARLTRREVIELIRSDARRDQPAIYKVWPDFEVRTFLTESTATVKADAARIAFSAMGEGITWAVADTGIDAQHPHFAKHSNLDIALPVVHMDFTGERAVDVAVPTDPNGHGTHVAGIIAGESAGDATTSGGAQITIGTMERGEDGAERCRVRPLQGSITGVAPKARLVSLRVLDADGNGRVSNLIAAAGYIQKVNEHGRWRRIDGVNMSVGYGFDPEWFACGQSPLCVEVDRLVRSGVSVVVAAGNTGYWRRGGKVDQLNSGLALTINDPGNARMAITVGSTHRSEPHVYGVSYFSSKGPTGDGRAKPDLVAPGEQVLSCAAGKLKDEFCAKAGGREVHYGPRSGTSMAAPHVSGAIAAFLSIRKEFRGQPEQVKEIFLKSATDLGREVYFQGRGLVDLMRAIQSV
jgi:subtilisin family serine protease